MKAPAIPLALALALALALLQPVAATAQGGDAVAEARAERLDDLHGDLARSASPGEAERLATLIWQLWLRAPDAEAQALMDRALERRRAGDYDAAIAVLDELTAGWPGYAEGWNQRATLFFLQNRYGPSLADVAQVLALEPRHFGALAGRAIILFRQGRDDDANRALLEALRVHPWLAERGLLDPGYEEQPL
ncbi:MAG: hypothetical protein AAF899_01915 [Pseudomonadota bacterium]